MRGEVPTAKLIRYLLLIARLLKNRRESILKRDRLGPRNVPSNFGFYCRICYFRASFTSRTLISRPNLKIVENPFRSAIA